MQIAEFAEAIAKIGIAFKGSCTSWGRTVHHTTLVRGFNGDPHTWWLGADLVWDVEPDHAKVEAMADSLALHVLWEGTHAHLQPKGWVNKPL